MNDYSEDLARCIKRSENLVISTKSKMHTVEKHLRLNEKINLHGLRGFMDVFADVTNSEINEIIKKHPLKFSVLKRLIKENPALIEDVRDHGFWYVCVKIEQDRSIKKREQQVNNI